MPANASDAMDQGMIEIETKYFGRVSRDAGLIIEFPNGLPAFERERAFLAIEHPRTAPLVLLQSAATQHLCFLALPVGKIDPGYQLQISPEDRAVLGLEPTGDPPGGNGLVVLALVAVGKDGRISANLMSPIVVNSATGRAVQSVRWDGAYSHEHAFALQPAETDTQEQPCS